MPLKDTWIDKIDNQDFVNAEDINSVANAVIDLENQLEETDIKNVPDYIKNEAERVINNIQANRTAKSLIFPMLSDFHLYSGDTTYDDSLISAQYAGMGISELKKRVYLDFVGYLGDYSMGAATYTVEQVKKDLIAAKETTDATNIQTWCVGNHDLNYGKNRDRTLTSDELYSYIGANSCGIKPYANIERCYGYLDFENQKIRIIYLNTCDASDWEETSWNTTEGQDAWSEWISPTQIRWIADTALDFTDKENPAEWGIVLVGHHPLHYGYKCFGHVMELLEAYKDSASGSMECGKYNDYISSTEYREWVNETVTYDFTSGEKAEIICNIHGHNHNCGYSKISSSSWGNDATTNVEPWLWRFCIPNICVGRENEAATNSSSDFAERYGEFDENGSPVYWYKESGTAKATSFCVVNVDRKNEKIYAHIFGAGIDRELDYSKPAYTNLLPISTAVDSEAIYNGTGYKDGIKFSSSGGAETAQADHVGTGLMPIGYGTSLDATGQQVIYLANTKMLPGNSNTRVALYDANKNFLGTDGANSWVTTPTHGKAYYTLGSDGYINMIDVTAITANYHVNLSKDTAYFRICAPGIDGNTIITVNEKIV